ncbi:MAG: hypothetical protein WDO24_09335 [Pseudomonadota bacterium]
MSWWRSAERVEFSRALIARLPQLKLIALVGRGATTIDYEACTEHGVAVSTGKSQSEAAPAELTVALMTRGAAQHRARGRAHEARRLALHPVASAARQRARHLRPGQDRQPGGGGRARARHDDPGPGAARARANARWPPAIARPPARPSFSSNPTCCPCICGCGRRRSAWSARTLWRA